MAKLVLAVLLLAVGATTGTLDPNCKNCEVCVGRIPIREGDCVLPVELTGKYEVCPVPPPTPACPCLDVDPDGTASVTFDGVPYTDPIALLLPPTYRVKVVIANGRFICDPYAIVTKDNNGVKMVDTIGGTCDETFRYQIGSGYIDPDSGTSLVYKGSPFGYNFLTYANYFD